MACPGSIRLSRSVPDAPSFYAEEGTVAHTVAELCLRDQRNALAFLGQKFKGESMELEVTEEMCEAVQMYVDLVRTDKLMLGGTIMLETRFDLSKLTKHLPGQPPLYGRNDCCLLTDDGTLIVYDYKHGRGHAVDVEGNPQLMYYALGALLANARARKHKIKAVEMVIVQPRAAHRDGPIRRAAVELIDLQAWAADLVAAVERTLAPDAPLVAGPHCLFCRASAICPAQANRANEVAALDFEQFKTPVKPETLTIEQISRILRWFDEHGEAWFKALKHYAHTLVNAGQTVPGWKLVQKRPERVYREADQDVIASNLKKDFGLTDDKIYTEPELKSVAQIEKLLTKEQRKAFAAYWEKRSSGTVLAPESDPRPALPPPAVSDFAAFLLD